MSGTVIYYRLASIPSISVQVPQVYRRSPTLDPSISTRHKALQAGPAHRVSPVLQLFLDCCNHPNKVGRN